MASSLETIVRIAQEAGDAARVIQQSGKISITDKAGVFGTHFFTEADTTSENIIITRLRDSFPGTSTVSEEKENDPTIPHNAFIVDPIDGTPCFIHGCDEWGVMITKLVNHFPEMAVIYIPGRSLLATAVRGEGCYVNGQRVSLKPWPKELQDKTMIGIELGPWWAKDSLPSTVLLPLLERFAIRSVLSGAYGTIAMLRGETQAWVNLNVGWPWDFAPGWLFMREIGGWVSGPDGSELDFTQLKHMDVVYAISEEIAQQILPFTRQWIQHRQA